MYNKYLIFAIGMIILISFVSAETIISDEPSFEFQQYKKSTISVPIQESNYSECTNCNCYITLHYPNGTIFIDNQATTYSNGYANYVLEANKTTVNGDYPTRLICGDGSDSGFSTFIVNISPRGDLALFLVLLLSSIVCFLTAYLTEYEFLGFFSGILFVLTGIYSMIYGITDLANLYTRGISMISIGIGLVIIIAVAYDFAKVGGDD